MGGGGGVPRKFVSQMWGGPKGGGSTYGGRSGNHTIYNDHGPARRKPTTSRLSSLAFVRPTLRRRLAYYSKRNDESLMLSHFKLEHTQARTQTH